LSKENDNSEEDNDHRSIINKCFDAIENENTAEATVSKSLMSSKTSDVDFT